MFKFCILNLLIKNINMPMPTNIYYWWNFGSLLGVCLMLQIFSGFFLSLFYENNFLVVFDSIMQIDRNVSLGWLIRSIHSNGASLFFILIYLHIGRGLYFKSFYLLKMVWVSGVVILLLLFMTAFIGYVLPWGQMSFWGATVITNLLTSIPYIGKMMTLWLWGNFSVSKATLIRFFSFHFILPFILLVMVVIHIIFLHNKGSNNPLGVNSLLDKVSFFPYFVWKDLMGVMICFIIFFSFCLIFPYYFMDPDNFIKANPMVTPPHIQPEWYFLFAYAILRTVPNKLGGVVALLFSILILFLLVLLSKNFMNKKNYKFYKFYFFTWVMNFIFLTLMGTKVIEEPYLLNSKFSSLIYFLFYLIYL
uniref:Cytochrome b n=1 Tax=Typhlodromus pineus TaxID=3061201 RepID=A0AAU6QDU8_9ACAR